MKNTEPAKRRLKRKVINTNKRTQDQALHTRILSKEALPYSRPLTKEEKVTILAKLNREIRLDKLRAMLIRIGLGLFALLLLYLYKTFV